MLQRMTIKMLLIFCFRKSIYNDSTRFMVSWWVTDSYFNNELIQIDDIKIMTSVYVSSVSFVSRVRSKSIGHNIYTGWRINFRSKPTIDLNYSYSRSHFSSLPQAVAKKLIYSFSCKVSYASKIIDHNGFSPND